jgi:hypothetical protein
MERAALLRASREEHALYEALGAVYDELATVLGDERAEVDPVQVAALDARAEEVSRALQALAAALAPHRLGTDAVPADVQDLWRGSAALAAKAAEANVTLRDLARRHQERIMARLAEVRGGRRALAGYRPAAGRTRVTDASA